MGRGIFRPYPYRPPRRIFLPSGPAAPPTPEAPGLKQRMDLAVLTDVNARELTRVRAVNPLPLLGVAPPVVGGVFIARLFKERHRRIMFERMARKVFVETAPLAPVVRQSLFPARPLVARPVQAPAARAPLFVPIPKPVIPSSVPPRTRIPLQPPARAPAARAPAFVPGVPAAPPTVGPTPTPARPPVQPPARVPPVRRPPVVPGVFVPAPVSSIPLLIRRPARALRPFQPLKRTPLVSGFVPPPPTVGYVHLRRTAFPVVAVVYRFRKPPVIPTSIPAPFLTVCTTGTWSAAVSFLPCDDYRLELDGPAADQVKASVNMEFEE